MSRLTPEREANIRKNADNLSVVSLELLDELDAVRADLDRVQTSAEELHEMLHEATREREAICAKLDAISAGLAEVRKDLAHEDSVARRRWDELLEARAELEIERGRRKVDDENVEKLIQKLHAAQADLEAERAQAKRGAR